MRACSCDRAVFTPAAARVRAPSRRAPGARRCSRAATERPAKRYTSEPLRPRIPQSHQCLGAEFGFIFHRLSLEELNRALLDPTTGWVGPLRKRADYESLELDEKLAYLLGCAVGRKFSTAVSRDTLWALTYAALRGHLCVEPLSKKGGPTVGWSTRGPRVTPVRPLWALGSPGRVRAFKLGLGTYGDFLGGKAFAVEFRQQIQSAVGDWVARKGALH